MDAPFEKFSQGCVQGVNHDPLSTMRCLWWLSSLRGGLGLAGFFLMTKDKPPPIGKHNCCCYTKPSPCLLSLLRAA